MLNSIKLLILLMFLKYPIIFVHSSLKTKQFETLLTPVNIAVEHGSPNDTILQFFLSLQELLLSEVCI